MTNPLNSEVLVGRGGASRDAGGGGGGRTARGMRAKTDGRNRSIWQTFNLDDD